MTLPELDAELCVSRAEVDVARRMLCMSGIVALSFDLSRKPIIESWLEREKLIEYLTKEEARFLKGGYKNIAAMQWRVESLYALAWSSSLSEDYQSFAPCPDDLVSHFPSISRGESSALFISKIKIRPNQEIIEALDIFYCLHWRIRNSLLEGSKASGPLPDSAIIERRRALEWLFSDEDWEAVSLDT
nr:DUF4272 domain-containing protein [Permianibacter aggregans]